MWRIGSRRLGSLELACRRFTAQRISYIDPYSCVSIGAGESLIHMTAVLRVRSWSRTQSDIA